MSDLVAGGALAPEEDTSTDQYSLPPQVPVNDNTVSARLHGYDWPDIEQHLSDSTATAQAAGYDDGQIAQHLGLGDPKALSDRLRASAQSNLGMAAPDDHPLAAASQGMLDPDSAARAMPLDGPSTERMAAHAGMDAPTTSVPTPGSDNPSALATDDLTQDVRSSYARALLSGETSGPQDFAERHIGAVWGAAAQIDPEGAVNWGGVTGAAVNELAAKLPSHQDTTDEAIALVHAQGLPVTAGLVSVAKDNLLDRWQQTGNLPAATGKQAQSDPELAQQLVTPQRAPTLQELSQPGRDAIKDPTNWTGPLVDLGGGWQQEQAKWQDELEKRISAGEPLGKVMAGLPVPPVAMAFGTHNLGEAGAGFLRGATQAPAEALSDAAAQSYLRLYHGTPHTFPAEEGAPLGKFNLQAVGTGEGLQAYGHGLYFAENPETAAAYQRRLAGGSDAGQVYEANLHAPPEQFMDWEKPLSQQAEPVQTAVRSLNSFKDEPEDLTGEDVYKRLKQQYGASSASMVLRKGGVSGVRYLDQGSRATGEGSRNYVVFNPQDVSIAARSGETVDSFLNRSQQAVADAHPGMPPADQATAVHQSILGHMTRMMGDQSGSARNFFVTAEREARLRASLAGKEQGQRDIRYYRGEGDRQLATAKTALEGYVAETNKLMPEHLATIKGIREAGGVGKYIDSGGRLDPLTAMKAYVEGRETPGAVNPFPAGHPLNGLADTLRDVVQGVRASLEADPLFDGMSYHDDYYRHNWKDPGAADRIFGAGRLGTSASTKARKLPTEMDGLEQGLDPLFPNPITNTLQYTQGMLNYKAGLNVLARGKELGQIHYSTSPTTPPFEGWQRLVGRSTGTLDAEGQTLHAWAPPGYAKAWNSWAGQGFYAHPWAGPLYRGLQYSANMMTGFKLALSGYHALNIAQETGTAALTRSIGNIRHGELLRAMGNIGMGAAVLPEMARNIARGHELQNVYLGLKTGTPLDSQLMDLWTHAGGAPGSRAAIYRTDARDNLFRSFRQGVLGQQVAGDIKGIFGTPEQAPAVRMLLAPAKAVGFFGDQIGRVMDQLNAPLFDHIIPNVKRASWANEMADWLRRNPTADGEAQLARARQVMDSMDDRFGELNQDNLFWNRYAKQALNLMTVSVGWEFGTLRAFLGGAGDVAKGQMFDSTRARWLIGFPAMLALQANAYQYMRTGQFTWQTDTPGRDILAPRTGGQTKYGPERAVLPGYQKEVIKVMTDALKTPDFMGMLQNVGSYFTDKANPLMQGIMKMLTDRDWDGKSLRIKLEAALHAPPGFLDYAKAILKDMAEPIAMGQTRAAGTHISKLEQYLGIHAGGVAMTNPAAYQRILKSAHDRELKSDQAALRRQSGQQVGSGVRMPSAIKSNTWSGLIGNGGGSSVGAGGSGGFGGHVVSGGGYGTSVLHGDRGPSADGGGQYHSYSADTGTTVMHGDRPEAVQSYGRAQVIEPQMYQENRQRRYRRRR